MGYNTNNKLIAKNTLLLYFRMLFMMAITLYTNRVVLDKLGVVDYGIYNIVGGIVVMMSFLSGCMSNSIQRYLSFEIGRQNEERANNIFNASIFVHIGIAIVVVVTMESIGLWYLNNCINIPANRLNAANWVFQCSIATAFFTIIQVPYNALIISKERMGIYAYFSIVEVSLKLLVVFLLTIGHFDKLKLYSVLIAFVTIIILQAYRIYCKKMFREARFRMIKDMSLIKELLNFSGWNMLSELAWTFTGPGVNLILNFFYGPVVNAARGLAEQVNGAVSKFVQNFQIAVNPQLIKQYAAGEIKEMNLLLFRSTRFSFYLLYTLALPLILKMDFILHLWLKEVPTYTTEFCQLVLICSLVSVNSTLLPKIAWAHGDIKKYQIIVSSVLVLNFPCSYILLKFGFSPLSTMYAAIAIQGILIVVRLYLVSKMVNISKKEFLKEVELNILLVGIVSLILPISINSFVGNTFVECIFIMVLSSLSVIVTVYLIGLKKEERKQIKHYIVSKCTCMHKS